MKRGLLISGILSSLLYVAMNIFIPMLFEGYNSASQTVSELSAIGAPTRTLWIWLGFVYTLLMIAFAWGIWQSTTLNRNLHIAGRLMLTYGIISLLWPFFPMHQREALAAGKESLTDNLHIALAMVTVLLMTMSIGFGAAALDKRFRIYSIMTVLILLLFGLLTGSDAPNIKANLPTPWVGVWERINIGVFLLWVVVLAIILLKTEKLPKQIKGSRA